MAIRLKYQMYSLLLASLVFTTRCEDSVSPVFPNYTGQKGIVYNIEGNEYETIGIGTQIWMAENLKTTLYNDGSKIPQVLKDSVWDYLHSPGYCWYKNDSIFNKRYYGALYNFYAVETGLLCPVGWHVPTNDDWNILKSFIGNNETAGGKLKDYNSPLWKEPNPCFANNYDFLALPGGYRYQYKGNFRGMGEIGYWWTGTLKDKYDGIAWSMTYSGTGLYGAYISKEDGCSVRCVKD